VSIDKTEAEVRACNARLDEYCVALGRDPATLERAYFGTDKEEQPFASADALHEFVGLYHEASIRRK
jgi:hypothetical protein